jgi:hypothetical protein
MARGQGIARGEGVGATMSDNKSRPVQQIIES